MADNKKSVNLLPEYLQSVKNSKFLSGTIDPLIQTPQIERIDGFVGSKISPNYNIKTDYYINEDSSLRTNYSLEPALILKDQSSKITDAIAFDDLINEIKIQGGNTDNLDLLFRSKFYSYDPYIDWDKLVNYTHYHWLPNGPDSILVDDLKANIESTSTYTILNNYSLSNGMKLKLSSDNKEYYVEGVGTSIKLIEVTLLNVDELVDTIYNEKFDSDAFDNYPFDGDKKLPLTAEYTTINRASIDSNPWSRYNRWFHLEIIRITAEINKSDFLLSLDSRAKRPIIEFKPDIQLYNFGNIGIGKIDLIDDNTLDAFGSVDGTLGYYVDGILLAQGNTVIFNADVNDDVRGKIYIVDFDFSTNPPTLQLVESINPVELNSIVINSGNTYLGTSWYYNANSHTWIYAQQHTKINQAPLFDLYNHAHQSYGNTSTYYNSNFVGCKIFGYDIGTGTADSVLGFPLKYQNSVGVGSYLFKNYFMTDSIIVTNSPNVISSTISTGITYFKVSDNYVNVWQPSVEYHTPIIEIQEIVNATNTTTIQSVKEFTNVSILVNSKLTTATISGLNLTFNNTLNVNDVVSLSITSNNIPNSNGFYEAPIGLTHNPLNGPISDMTLSELSDHLATMINRIPEFSGDFPGINNLRDLSGYSKYGTRLIVNSNPIAFAKMFLGKKEHNLVDAIRYAGDQYNQFKMYLLKSITNIDYQLSPADALDKVLININNNKDARAPYYRSDMLGYGSNKIVKSYIVSNINIDTYPIGVDFNLSTLSFKSVLVYIGNEQLIYGKDYDITMDEIVFHQSLNINDVINIHYYPDTQGSFIPPTPSKLGLYPTYAPIMYSDDSYRIDSSILVIRGHDGSIMPAYNDYRDAIILEYEKRVFNNIKVEYDAKVFDVNAALPGIFRNDRYSLIDVSLEIPSILRNDAATKLLTKDFIKWTGIYNIDASTNNVFDEGDPFTWNYKNSYNTLTNTMLSGYWRSIYKDFFDTDRPDIHPWEMLGHASKPTWWDDNYNWINPTKRAALINAVELGIVNPTTTEPLIDNNYARPGFDSIVPVDTSGMLLPPSEFLASENSYNDKIADWKFGDQGPAETAWRKSSYWPFALNAAAALLDPCGYSSSMFDTSRTSLNSNTSQLTYLEDDLYLNPNKMVLEGQSNAQTAGYGVYVVEVGLQKDLHYLDKLQDDLTYINFNLFHKLGGFVSKDKLQIVIDSIDPISQAPGAILPPEDYTLLLNTSNPIKSSSISGVIIQKSNGNFVIKGYDKVNPYFEILSPIKTLAGVTLTVGGKSEVFTEWTGVSGSSGLGAIDTTAPGNSVTTHYYKQGQIVSYNGKYYRVKIGHTTQSTFDPALFYQLPSLPMVGGSSVVRSSKFENQVTKIPYGTNFSTIQEVYDMLLGYGAYLEKQGFIFDEYNSDLGEIVDWNFTGKEFLYWTTQNWADGNLITLSPFSDYLKYSFTDSVVDNISTGKYEYSLLKADGKSFPINKFTLSREDGVCTVKTIDTLDGIFFATLNSVQKEHGMVIKNKTIFNDTIYDIETGYKQRRIKLSGFRTLGWNGDLSSPGFIYDNVDITDWIANGKYLPGNVVRYNGSYYEADAKIINDSKFDFTKWIKLNKKPESNLLTNFDYKINQFEDFYSLDIDNFDATQQQLAQHLIGYTPRTFLNNIFTNNISQYKFYQGFIKEKGTKNAIDKISKVGKFARQGDITFNEEWAFRLGSYGSFGTYNELEFTLDEGSSSENPFVIKFADSKDTNPLINYILPSNLLISPDTYIPSSTFTIYPSTFSDSNIKLPTAGYVRSDDVTATAYNKNSLLDIANNSLIQEGNTFWLGFLDNGDWNVYRYTEMTARIAGVFVSSPAVSITFTTDINHNLSVGDIVSIVNFNNQVNGIHIITDISRLDQFTVSSDLTTIINSDLLTNGLLFKFEKARYNNFAELSDNAVLSTLKNGEKIWVDNGSNGKWQVYEKIQNYTTGFVEAATTSVTAQRLGESIFTLENSSILLMSAPGKFTNAPIYGNVGVYLKNNNQLIKQFDYTLNNHSKIYCQTDSENDFGLSLSIDVNKGLLFAGAPAASNIVIPSANTNTTGIAIFSDGSGITKTFAQEGIVKISSTNKNFIQETTEKVLVHPYATTSTTAAYSRFGHSIYNSQPSSNTSTLLLVGAPGSINSDNTYTGRVYAYNVLREQYYNATKAQVIYALAASSLAPLFYGEVTITNWMVAGIDQLEQFYYEYRLVNPVDAAAWDADRAADNVGIKNTRIEVIAAYQNNILAELYPSEDNIRYWMINGIGPDSRIFNESVIAYRSTHPTDADRIDSERVAAENSNIPATKISGHPSGITLKSVVSLNAGSQFGHSISGDSNGSIIAVGAPYYINTISNTTGVIQLYDKNLHWFQSIPSPFIGHEAFGENVVISSDGTYLVASSPEIRGTTNGTKGRVAIYRLSGTGIRIQASRASVILAYASNLLAPLYPSELDIHIWTVVGLDSFDSTIDSNRAASPAAAAAIDKERAADSLGMLASRADVIIAYQTNVEAPLYPTEAEIRYWMATGLGTGTNGFAAEITYNNSTNPSAYAANLAQRITLATPSPYLSTRFEVINAYASNLRAEVNPSNGDILSWMTSGLGTNNITFNTDVESRRTSNPSLATSIDAARAADAVGTSGAPIRSSRAAVIAAYQGNLDANPYPTEQEIRYWMSVGLGYLVATNNPLGAFNAAVTRDNALYPDIYLSWLQARAADYPKASRGQVILAYASNLLTELYPNETAINYWMVQGLTNFDSSNNTNRANDPALAAAIDMARAADAINIKSSRAAVISAYQTNVDAPFYPTEKQIRRWMIAGLDSSSFTIFNETITANNLSNPTNAAIYRNQRLEALPSVDFTYDLYQVIDNPLKNNDLKFGKSIAISDNSNKLAIGAVGVNGPIPLKFDINFKDGETTFDQGTTNFSSFAEDSGTVFLYYNIDGSFVQSENITDPSPIAGDKFGYSVAVTNNNTFVGAPSISGVSKFYQFNKADTSINGLKLLREQPDLVDVSTIDRVALIDSFKEEVIEYLDVIDPLKGKIAGIAEQELKYKSSFDPAVYSIGNLTAVVDSNTSWIDDHVGELWWDISTAKYQCYEQGDEIFRKNNWGKLFPGATIDVYEWVKSDLLPSEWASQADTNDGLTKGISGQPKYPDNSILSVKQLFNNVTRSFENVYFFWVKNKVNVPEANNNRRISSYQVASIIADPIANGLKFVEILSKDSVAFANVQSMLISDRINANIAINSNKSEIPRHTEWELIAEGNENNMPPPLLEKKLIDSLLGHDQLGNNVPAINTTYRNRYGIGIRPQQTLFKDRIEALRNQIAFANSVLIKEQLTGNYNFNNLNSYDTISDAFYREYDIVVDSLSTIDTLLFEQATIKCFVNNGKIISVEIIKPGFGYLLAPLVTINSTAGEEAELLTEINSNGEIINVTISNAGYGYVNAPTLIVRPHTAIIRSDSNYNGRWTKHIFDYIYKKWNRVGNQKYDTRLYWQYTDWIKDSYSKFKDYRYSIDATYEIDTLSNVSVGDYVRIKNIGDGRYAIIEKLADTEIGDFSKSYNFVYIEKGTIQIKDSIWNFSNINVSYDSSTLEDTLYDQVPDLELYHILLALKDDIFIGNLKVNWNLFFFKAVKYALTEQKILDWAFKTSFIDVYNSIGNLDQRPVYKLDNEKYFENYIEEVKPYHTNIRRFTSKYSSVEETSTLSFTDFDVPSASWTAAHSYCVGNIIVADPGTLYTQKPTITISGGGANVTPATAEAYIRSGVVYQILVTDPGAGYTETPTITISGGGPYVTSTASVSVSLLNLTTRKNIIGLKFDRVSAVSEIGNVDVTEEFICSGKDTKFVLSVLADRNKLNIIPSLDGQLVLSTDYTIEYYSEENNGYTKHYSRFVFLNYVPKETQVFKITYKKNINLYTAVDRIENLYTATDSISSLMNGVVYPGNVIQGLPFDYSPAWDTVSGLGKYDPINSGWSDSVGYYASAKIVSSVAAGDTTIYLNTTTDIVVGQIISLLNSPTSNLRKDTVVNSVNSLNNSITISQTYYAIKSVRATSTNINSDIVVITVVPFNGAIVVGDLISLDGIEKTEFNGIYYISSITDKNKFIVKSNSVLSTTATVLTYGEASITISSMLGSIDTDSVLLDHISETFIPDDNNHIEVDIMLQYDDITKIEIFKDGETLPMLTGIPIVGPYPTSEYYHITKNVITGGAIVNFYQMTSNSYDLDFYSYTNPKLEFWKTDVLSARLDSVLPGGSVNWGNFAGGLGVRYGTVLPEEGTNSIIIDGDSFLNERSGYAPDECVAGHVLDSLGINVYTKAENSYPTVITGSFPVKKGTLTAYELSVPETEYAGIMVNFNGKIFDRVDNATQFTNSHQYYMIGNTIHLPLQSVSGTAGYTMVSIGGNYSLLDSNIEGVSGVTSATVISLLSSINDVVMAYVLVDGHEISQDTPESGDTKYYKLTAYSNKNNRASVQVYGIDTNSHTIEAWFFQSKYTKFNRLHEESQDGSASQSMFTLSFVPGNIEPVSAQVIVEIDDGSSGRRRLSPPWVSYYQIKDAQLTFAIDSKNLSRTYTAGQVMVYANGIELRPGFDYTFNDIDSTVTIISGLLSIGDVIAVVGLIDYDYIVVGNILQLTNPPVSTFNLKIISFTDHDKMLIRTERFNGTIARRYTLSFSVLSDNYVWVYVDGISLTARTEFEILDDMKTIQISDLIDVSPSSKITITTVNPQSYNNQIIGFRMFNDIFDRHHYKRLSKFHSTTLLRALRHTDNEIYLTDGNGIIPPNPLTNNPGIVIIDGERIEFAEKDGNTLRGLRRSSLGTGPATYSAVGTQVIDQSSQQTIPYLDTILVQSTSTTSTTYIISTVTTTATGAGIVLDPNIDAVNQVTVYYGGRQLRKTSLVVHDKFYDKPVYNPDPRTAYILIFGQSNIANYGEHTDSYTPNDKVKRLDINGNWELAVSPGGPNRLATGYNWSTGSSVDIPGGPSGGNMDGRIGDTLLQSGKYDKVYIVNVAVGGIPLAWWLSTALPSAYLGGVPRNEDNFPYVNNRLFERLQFAVSKANELGFEFTHVLYGAGESDSIAPNITPSDVYQSRFAQLRNELRTLGVTAPIFISKTSYFVNPPYTTDIITNAQQAIVNNYSDVYLGPNTDLYGDSYRWDHLHFKTSGLSAIGSTWGNTIVDTLTSFDPVAPEFSINTSTNELLLNISDYNGIPTNITIIQKKGQIWTGTESLLTSNVIQAEFLQDRKSLLPDIYYYGGESVLKDNDNVIITDDNDQPLEGY